ncbi:hypothetical protein SAMN04488505_102869 [Chitinophaga rupis]|uniref:Uncharacterized protein n=1 Tax=Chitinophaga rupis TaxID=573321 RepID=A0A1H7SAS8_9BACT|nr:hypothetical protein [Chitinophaga rupis]SEL69336.1 hypothetical protein SAMN04488505_102869 [Chitinophaga rupis]
MESIFNYPINTRLKSGGHIAVEVSATSDQNRRWIAIYKPNSKPIDETIPEHIYSILDFELKKEKTDEYFADEDMLNQKRYYVNTEEELIDLLLDLRVDPKRFTYPWKCDYPL